MDANQDDDGPEAIDNVAGEARRQSDALTRQNALSERLKRMYDHVVEETIPDEFKDLLARLTDAPETDAALPPTGEKGKERS